MKNLLRLASLLLSISLLVFAMAVRAATPSPGVASKLDKRLAPIAAAAEQHLDSAWRDSALLRQARHLNTLLEPRWNAAGQVQVYLHYDPANAAPDKEQLAALGATGVIDRPEMGVIQAWVPASQLAAVGDLPGVARVSLPRYVLSKRAPVLGPVHDTGSVDTEGDGILNASSFRTKTGDTGQGVTVGVISDGDVSIAESQKSGNLPTNIWDDPKDKGGSSGFSAASSGDEGTAMMEIVYDLAPGVGRLGFCGPTTSVEFLTCLDDLKANINANVIVDDLGFPGGAMFSNDDFASGVQSFAQANPSTHLVSAAGNDGTGFWEGDYMSTAVTTTVNGEPYTSAQNFNTGGGTTSYLQLSVRTGDTIAYIVEWADPWDDNSKTNDPNDYDVVVFDNPNGDSSGPGAGHLAVACNQGINVGPDPNNSSSTTCNQSNTQSTTSPGPTPVQGSQWVAKQSSYYLEVFQHAGSPSAHLKILVFDQSAFPVTVTPTTQGSVFGQPAIPEVTAVGAVNSASLQLESFSSMGPVEVGTGNAPLTSVMKPDFVAPDCVTVSGAGGFESPFCGTSAAAPHIAGLMALLVSGYPGTAPSTLLQESATPMGNPVPNGEFGYGLPNMQNMLDKGLRPAPKKSSGRGNMDLFSLLALALLAASRRR